MVLVEHLGNFLAGSIADVQLPRFGKENAGEHRSAAQCTVQL